MPPRHHGGGGGRMFRGGGGGYFAPPSYGYPVYYDEPNYVPVFIVEDDADRAAAAAAAAAAAQKEAAKKKAGASGLGILSGPRHRRRARPVLMGLGVVYGNTDADPVVQECQQFLNPILSANGYSTIGTDGKLGKKTCGAVAWLMQGGASDYNKGTYFDLSTVPQSVYQVWNVCASSAQEAPTPVTAAAKTSSYNVAVSQNATAPLNTDAVIAAQTALNVALVAAGMCPIGIDGKAGPDTCGAQTWLIANAGGDGLTQDQRDAISRKCSTSSKNTPAACPAPASTSVAPVVAPVAPPPSLPVVPPKPKMSTASIVAGAGIVAAVGALAYAYYQHKTAGG